MEGKKDGTKQRNISILGRTNTEINKQWQDTTKKRTSIQFK